ncbi:MAG: histidinol-phosphatase [Pseudomonadota bacterium]
MHQPPPFSFFHALADAARAAILPLFRQTLFVDDKRSGPGLERSDFDPVTEADRNAERAMRALIEETYPDHGIVGEEFGDKPAQSPFTWVLDPIDGTRAFIAGLPTWGTIIGLTRDNAPVAGLFDQGFIGERVWGDGQAAWYRGPVGEHSARVRPMPDLGAATLMTTTPALFQMPEERAAYDRVEAETRLVRYGGDAYSYALLALGQIDVVVETGLAPYDIVGMIPIVEGAGGCVTNWIGRSAAQGGRVLAVGDLRLHASVRDLLVVTD